LFGIHFDPIYFLYLAPAILLGIWAQFRVRSTYTTADQVPARLSGAEAARLILNSAGLTDVDIEVVPGNLTDHYDPRHRVLRLSRGVYERRSMASVGIAAHEAGHALQHAWAYAPLTIRNMAVPMASFGGGISPLLILVGAMINVPALIWVGIVLFGGVAVFQVINLPVEFDASSRAKQQLVQLGVIHAEELPYVSSVLNAAAWTYVAGTLQALLTLAYYVMRFGGRGRD
jgi:hypothetical protein